jgi:hypothetical protein
MNSPTKAEPINDTFFSWESWAGEVRINLIRLVALAIFYAHHLARVYLLKDAPLDLSREIRILTLVISFTTGPAPSVDQVYGHGMGYPNDRGDHRHHGWTS